MPSLDQPLEFETSVKTNDAVFFGAMTPSVTKMARNPERCSTPKLISGVYVGRRLDMLTGE